MCGSHEHEQNHFHNHEQAGACCGGGCGCNHGGQEAQFAEQGKNLLTFASQFMQEGALDDADIMLNAARVALIRSMAIETEDGIWLFSTAGLISHQRGQLQAAERWFRQAREIAEKIHPENHPGKAIILSNLGDVLALIGKTDEAIETLQNAVAELQASEPGDGITAEIIASVIEDKTTTLQQLGA